MYFFSVYFFIRIISRIIMVVYLPRNEQQEKIIFRS